MPYARERLIKLDDSPNADPVCVEFDINQPRVAERYYSRNSKIDESNCTRQYDFQMDRNLHTKDFSIRVNTSILGMNDVDTYYLGKACKWWYNRNPEYFYYDIAEDMIDNRWTERRTQRNRSGKPKEHPGYIINIVPNCTPAKKRSKRKIQYFLKDNKFLAQSRCKVCRAKTTYVCSSCGDYLFHDKSGRFCLDSHHEEKH